ncbi:MAG: hypothetical protein JXM70_00005 [Pirellulales bacterium]|nr:hypothetical protein [Pirellulales bacterium]
MNNIPRNTGFTLTELLMLGVCCLLFVGCGGPKTKVVSGTVTVKGEKAQSGQVLFIPIEGTPGSNNAASIVDGEYRIEGRGGVMMGKYRVEVVAKKKTGRQVMQDTGFEKALADEYITISPPQYAGKQSPLTAEIDSSFDGRFDIDITP